MRGEALIATIEIIGAASADLPGWRVGSRQRSGKHLLPGRRDEEALVCFAFEGAKETVNGEAVAIDRGRAGGAGHAFAAPSADH